MIERPADSARPTVPANEETKTAGIYGMRKRWHPLRLIIIAAIVLIALLTATLGYIQKGLWMQQLGYTGVFWKLLFLRWGLSSAALVVVFLYLWINVRLAARNSATSRAGLASDSTALAKLDIIISPTAFRLAASMITAAAALVFAYIFYGQWDTYLRFRNGGSFGLSDPLFGVDLGYYVFRLPFYELLQGSLSALALISVLLVLTLYGYFGSLRAGQTGQMASRRTKAVSHLSILSFVLAASWGWGFYLDHYELLYSSLGVVYGAGYTADRVIRLAYWIMTSAAVALCALFVLNVFRPRFKVMVVAAGVYVGLYCVAVWLAPILFQRFKVQPNELALETPYLKNNIEFTRNAFGLDTIQETSYPALADVTPEVIARNQDTIQNIRLWDYRPLLQMYQQAQEIRLYYQFYQVDVDRYHLQDGYHQVMLSARELSPELPAEAQTWVNEKLQFTHGYGLAMSFVSQTTGGGFPRYIMENIPPESSFGLNTKQPSIYYGESKPGYRIVATSVKEFDYPQGNQNVYTSYEGKGGIPLDSLWKLFRLGVWPKGRPESWS